MRTDMLCQCCGVTFANIDDCYCMACIHWLDAHFHALKFCVGKGAITDFPPVKAHFGWHRGFNHVFMLTGRTVKKS